MRFFQARLAFAPLKLALEPNRLDCSDLRKPKCFQNRDTLQFLPNGNYLVELITIAAVQVTLIAVFVNLKKELIVDFEILLQQLKQFVEK